MQRTVHAATHLAVHVVAGTSRLDCLILVARQTFSRQVVREEVIEQLPLPHQLFREAFPVFARRAAHDVPHSDRLPEVPEVKGVVNATENPRNQIYLILFRMLGPRAGLQRGAQHTILVGLPTRRGKCLPPPCRAPAFAFAQELRSCFAACSPRGLHLLIN